MVVLIFLVVRLVMGVLRLIGVGNVWRALTIGYGSLIIWLMMAYLTIHVNLNAVYVSTYMVRL